MNAFAKHGITHLSASAINLFTAQPGLWCLEKLLGKRTGVGPSAHRGTSVEAGIEAGLFDPELPLEEAQRIAIEMFDKKTALSAHPSREKERDAIAPSVAIGLTHLRDYGIPEKPADGRQHKISINLDGVPVPFIGYLDFVFPDHNIIIDLKTMGALQSDISDSHARQGAIYHAAHGNAEIRFAYVTPKKIGVYKQDDCRDRLKEVIVIAQCMERFLSLSDDREFLTKCLAPDTASFYYKDTATRSAARDVWGF